MLYGRDHALPDSSEMEVVQPGFFEAPMLEDVTGDSVPDLVTTTGSERILVYVGFPEQRLEEQVGSGNEPGNPDSVVWWGKPWLTLRQPRILDPAGHWDEDPMLVDLGDLTGDSIPDVVGISYPYLIVYHTSTLIDEYIDLLAEIAPQPYSDVCRASVVLGDIDGSGERTCAIWAGGGVDYLKPLHLEQVWGPTRELPTGTGRPTSAVPFAPSLPQATLLGVSPNPGGTSFHLNWSRLTSTAELRVSAADGAEVFRRTLARDDDGTTWDADGVPPGIYFATLRANGTTTTVPIVVVR